MSPLLKGVGGYKGDSGVSNIKREGKSPKQRQKAPIVKSEVPVTEQLVTRVKNHLKISLVHKIITKRYFGKPRCRNSNLTKSEMGTFLIKDGLCANTPFRFPTT